MKIVVVLLLTKTTGDCKADRMSLGTASAITHGISMSGPLLGNSKYAFLNRKTNFGYLWALSIQEKNPEILVVAKVEFPTGKKLFHFVVNPSTWRCPTVDLELVQTTRNVNGTLHSVRKFQPGKRAHLFRFSTFSGNFPVGRTDETFSFYHRAGNSGNFD